MRWAWRSALAGAALAAAACTVASAQDRPPQVQVEHAAVRLVVIAEPRRNVSVTVAHGPSRLPSLSVRQEGGRVIVDGGLERPFGAGPGHMECHGDPSRGIWVSVTGVGRVDWRDLPVITAHVPLDASLSGAGAMYGQVGATRSLALASSGCGDWSVGPVQQAFIVSLAGSADLQGGDMGRLQARIAGSSDLGVHRIANGADAELTGSGNLRAAAVQGPLHLRLGGSGDVVVDQVDGPVQAVLSGSGDVHLKSGHAPGIEVAASGSSEFDFGGDAGRVQAETSGSGDIRIAHASGPVTQSRSGSGDIRIGR